MHSGMVMENKKMCIEQVEGYLPTELGRATVNRRRRFWVEECFKKNVMCRVTYSPVSINCDSKNVRS